MYGALIIYSSVQGSSINPFMHRQCALNVPMKFQTSLIYIKPFTQSGRSLMLYIKVLCYMILNVHTFQQCQLQFIAKEDGLVLQVSILGHCGTNMLPCLVQKTYQKLFYLHAK